MEHELEPSNQDDSILPFEDLVAPQPIEADPPPSARWLAFLSVLLGGLLAGLVGYGVGDLMIGGTNGATIGAAVGGITGAIGLGVVANVTLRAMGEWRSIEHPEAAEQGTDD